MPRPQPTQATASGRPARTGQPTSPHPSQNSGRLTRKHYVIKYLEEGHRVATLNGQHGAATKSQHAQAPANPSYSERTSGQDRTTDVPAPEPKQRTSDAETLCDQVLGGRPPSSYTQRTTRRGHQVPTCPGPSQPKLQRADVRPGPDNRRPRTRAKTADV